MVEASEPRLIRVGESERVGCKCKHKGCAMRFECMLSIWKLRGASFMPGLRAQLATGFESPLQVMVHCFSYKEEQDGAACAEEADDAGETEAGEAAV